MSVLVRRATAGDLEPAIAVWAASNLARGMPPSPQRIERVTEKVTHPLAIVLVAVAGDSVIGMLQAEPGRTTEGDAEIADLGHVSMLFVDPNHQRSGVGRQLLSSLIASAPDLDWHRLSLWTRRTNGPARGLYESLGFRQTSDASALADHTVIDRWQLDLS